MKLAPRLLIPALAAVVCAAMILSAVWWQLHLSAQSASTQGEASSGAGTEDLFTVTDISADPKDLSLLHLRKGDLLFLQGNWADAETEYQQAVSAGGGLTALRKLAQAELQRGQDSELTATIEQLKRAGARSEDLLLLQSIVYLRRNEFPTVKAMLDKASDSPQKAYVLGLLALLQGNHDESKKQFTTVVGGWEPVLRSHAQTILKAYDEYALFPDSPNIHLVTLLSRSLAQVQECGLALPLVTKVTQDQPDYRDAWIIRGYCELTMEKFDDALPSFEHAYALDPEKPEIQYFLARTYAGAGNHQQAVTFLQYALRNGFEPEKEVRQILAEEALKTGDAALALEQYKNLIDRKDADIQIYAGFVSTALRTGKKDDAYAKALEATQKWPDEAKGYELLGSASIELGKKADGKTLLQKAVQMDPTLTSAQEKLKKL